MEDLRGFLYKKEQVLEIYKNEKLLKEIILHGRDDWNGVKDGKTEYDIHYLDDENGVQIGVYSTYRFQGHTITSDFLGVLNTEIR